MLVVVRARPWLVCMPIPLWHGYTLRYHYAMYEYCTSGLRTLWSAKFYSLRLGFGHALGGTLCRDGSFNCRI